MDEKIIVERSKKFVKDYRSGLDDESRVTRGRANYPMLVLFVGDDMEECRQCCENTCKDLWMNNEQVVFRSIIPGTDISSVISQTSEKIMSASELIRLNVCIVADGTDENSDCIKNIINCVFNEFKLFFGKGNIDFFLFTISRTKNRANIESLKVNLSFIEEDLFERKSIPQDVNSLYSLIFGDISDGTAKPISDELINKAVASTIIVINNEKTAPNLTSTNIIKNTHTLVGFSQADIPLETVYIIGFDTFSDLIVDYYAGRHVDFVPENSFDVKKDILGEYIMKLRQFSNELSMNSQYLWRENALGNGVYSFEQLNHEYGNNLLKFFDANLSRKGIKTPTKEEILEKFTNYLFNYFIDNGLEIAKIHLGDILTKETQILRNNDPFISYNKQSYDFKKDEPAKALANLFNKIVDTRINELERIARDQVVLYAQSSDNKLAIISKNFTDIQNATQRCKVEACFKDANINSATQIAYEDAVNNRANEIREMLKAKKLKFDFSSVENFERDIFEHYETRIVKQTLFANMGNYIDDIRKLDDIRSRAWMDNQVAKASLTMRLITSTIVDPVFLTDLPSTTSMYITIKETNYPIVPVSGVSIFRVLKFRANIQQNELFVIQNL